MIQMKYESLILSGPATFARYYASHVWLLGKGTISNNIFEKYAQILWQRYRDSMKNAALPCILEQNYCGLLFFIKFESCILRGLVYVIS
jgi:hypothetical protein